MTRESRLMAGVNFLTVPSIIYGGYIMPHILSRRENDGLALLSPFEGYQLYRP